MGNFKIGEKVVCVKPIYNLVFNQIYTIDFLKICKCGCLNFSLIEIPSVAGYEGTYCAECLDSLGKECLWSSKRFRKLDYEFAENLLAEISEAMKSETIKN